MSNETGAVIDRRVPRLVLKALSARKRLAKRKRKRKSRDDAPLPVSRAQQVHFDRLLAALDASTLARDIADELTANGAQGHIVDRVLASDPAHRLAATMRSCSAGRRCGRQQCPRCRRARIGDRVDAAIDAFEGRPLDAVHWVTVIIDVEPTLFERRIVTNVLDPLGVRTPSNSEIAARTRAHVVRTRRKVDAAIRSLGPVMFLADGAFEIGVVDPATCGVHKERLLNDLDVATGAGAAPDLALVHLHFVCSVRRRDGYATRDEIAGALADAFPGRRRVFVKPLWVGLSVAANVRRLVGYSLKSFADSRPERATEIALVLDAIGARSISYVRRQGRRQPNGAKVVGRGRTDGARPPEQRPTRDN